MKNWILILGATALLSGQTLPPKSRMLTPEEMRADVADYVQVLEEVDIDPYAMTTKEIFTTRRAEMEARLTRPMSTREFYLELSALIATLRTGHAALVLPPEWNEHRHAGGRAFPLLIRVVTGRAFCIEDLSPTPSVEAGTEILAIDGRPFSEVWNALARLRGAELDSYRDRSAAYYFRHHLHLVYGTVEEYQLVVRRPAASSPEEIRLAGITMKETDEGLKRNSAARQNYSYRVLPGTKIGLINYRYCADAPKMQEFVDETFRRIRDEEIKGLIVDMRENLGGDSRVSELLLDHVTAKPYKQFGGELLRVRDRLKREYGEAKYRDIYGIDAWNAPEGTLLEKKAELHEHLHQPSNEPLRFQGPVMILSGPGTYSSGSSFVFAVKDYGLATLVGEECGGVAPSSGEAYTYTLPNSQFSCRLTTKWFDRPSLVRDHRGAKPDIEVVPTVDDIVAGRDVVLDAALREINRRLGR